MATICGDYELGFRNIANMVTLNHLTIGALLIFQFSTFSCDSFTSVASLIELVKTQNALLDGIREYQQSRLHKLENLQRKIEEIKQEHVKANKDPEDYFSNPINAFNLIKRIVHDWSILHNFVESPNATEDFGRVWNEYSKNFKLPNKSDLQDAIQGFAKIDITLSSELTWEECYEIGFAFYDKRDYLGALLWLEQALEKIKDTPDYNETLKVDIVQYMAYSHYMLGNKREAVSTMEQLLGVPFLSLTIDRSMEYFQLKKKDFVQNIVLGEQRVMRV